jgi:hypothetical protein
MLMRVSTKCPIHRQKYLPFKIKHLKSQRATRLKEGEKFFWEFFVHNRPFAEGGSRENSITF